MPGMFFICWPCCSPETGPLWSHCCCCLAACARIWRLFFVRSSTPRALRKGLTVASGADGLAGLSAVNGGDVAVAQPAKRAKATSSIEYRFIICRGDRFQKTDLGFHLAEILDALLDRLPGRYRPRSPNRGLLRPGSGPLIEQRISAI
jgi:hypothetical protein